MIDARERIDGYRQSEQAPRACDCQGFCRDVGGQFRSRDIG